MTYEHESTPDITVELEWISNKNFKSFGTLPRTLTAVEKAAAEIKRLREENALLTEEIEFLKAFIKPSGE